MLTTDSLAAKVLRRVNNLLIYTIIGTLIFALFVADNQSQAQQLPDLKVVGITMNPRPIHLPGQVAVLERGKSYQFEIRVINLGPGPVQADVHAKLQYRCVSEECTDDFVNPFEQWVSLGRVPVGQTNTSEFPPINPKSRGLYIFRFVVDPDNQHQEADESAHSNIWETTLYVK
jgi:hypothetical protein